MEKSFGKKEEFSHDHQCFVSLSNYDPCALHLFQLLNSPPIFVTLLIHFLASSSHGGNVNVSELIYLVYI